KRVLKNGRVEIEKVMMIKRHTKPTQKNPQGGIMDLEGSVAVANVALWCETCSGPRRVRAGADSSGKKVRVCVDCGTAFPRPGMGGTAENEDKKTAAAKKAPKGDAKAKGGKDGAKKGAGPAKVYKREQPPRLKKFYEDEVRRKMREEFGYANPMQIPRIVKISLNMGLGKA